VFGFLWTVLKVEGLFRKSLSKLWSLANQHAPEPHGLKRWRETLENQVKIRRQWFSQGMRKSVELSAYKADSTVVTSALIWTLTALDEDKEIEDFAARVPGFFDSRVVPDATSAVLPLMSHQPSTDPIFGSRLYDLLRTCIPEASLLDEKTRRNRLRVCLNCLWYFGRAYNQPGVSQPLPSYFLDALASPEITRRVQAEEDFGVRVIGRCLGALIVNKLVADINSRTDPISDGELACLSAILGTRSPDVKLLLSQPGAVALLNMISFTFDKIGGSVNDTVPSGVLDVVQQTLGILSQPFSYQEIAEARFDQPITLINGSDGKFERILVSRLLDLLNTCIQVPSPLTEGVRTSCLRVCLNGLWYFGRTFNQLGNSVPLPFYVRIAFTNPEMTRRIREQRDPAVRVIGRCAEALVVNKLAADINSRNVPVSNDELTSLSAILGTQSNDVRLCLSQPGTIELVNMASLALGDVSSLQADRMQPDARLVLQQTLDILSQALPAQANAELSLDQTVALANLSDDKFERTIVSHLHGLLNMCIPGASSLMEEVRTSCLRMCLKSLWHCGNAYHQTSDSLPSYFALVLARPEITRHFQTEQDPIARITGCCFGALIVCKLVDALKSPISLSGRVRNAELACISAILGPILGIEHREDLLLPYQLRDINLRNVVSLMYGEIDPLFTAAGMPPDALTITQDTLYILAYRLRESVYVPGALPMERLLQKIYSNVVDALSSNQLKNETVKTLNRLRQILEKLPSSHKIQ